jgi:hypothetical protein
MPFIEDKESRANASTTITMPASMREQEPGNYKQPPPIPGQMERPSSPILTPSARAVGAVEATPNEKLPAYEVFSSQDAVSIQYQMLDEKALDIASLDIPEAEKNIMLEHLQDQRDYLDLEQDKAWSTQSWTKLMESFERRADEIQAMDMPEEQKEQMLSSLSSERSKAVRAHEEGNPVVPSWIEPDLIIAGPLASTRIAAKTFSALTRGVITGPGSLGKAAFTKALAASIPTEVVVGQSLDNLEAELDTFETPWYVKAGIMLPLAMGAGAIVQTKLENSVDAIGEAFSKAGVHMTRDQLHTTVKTARNRIKQEVKLATTLPKIKKQKRPDRLAAVKKADKKVRPKVVFKKKDPMFSDIATKQESENLSFATLEDVKALNDDTRIFPVDFREAEDVGEFFVGGPSSRDMIKALKEKGYAGITDGVENRKFYTATEEVLEELSEEQRIDKLAGTLHTAALKNAKNAAGENSVTGMSSGLYAGTVWDEDQERIVGFDVRKALLGFGAGYLGYRAVNRLYTSPGRGAIMAGAKAKKAGKDVAEAIGQAGIRLKEAKKLEAAGKNERSIFFATNMTKTKTGEWAYYTKDDLDAVNLKDMESFKIYRLGEVWDEPGLREAYPEIVEETKVVWQPGSGLGTNGTYNPVTNKITLYADKASLKELMFHERQHAVSHVEGLPRGGSTETVDELLGWYQGWRSRIANGEAIETLEEAQIYQQVEDMIDTLPHMKVAVYEKMLTDYLDIKKQIKIQEANPQTGTNAKDLYKDLKSSIDTVKEGTSEYGKTSGVPMWETLDKFIKLRLNLEKGSMSVSELENLSALRSAHPQVMKFVMDKLNSFFITGGGEALEDAYKRRDKLYSSLLTTRRYMAFDLYKNIDGEVMANTRNIFEAGDFAARMDEWVSGDEVLDIFNKIQGYETKTFVSQTSMSSSKSTGQGDMLKNELATEMAENGIRPGFMKRWENSGNKLIESIQHWVDSKVYGTQLREAMGISLPTEYRALLKDYDRQTNRILDHTLSLAKELDDLAPTQKEQKRLMQLLRGGVSADPEVTKAARRVNEIFKELRIASQEAGLRNYDVYDTLTKAERRDLRNIIKFSDNQDQVIAAQKVLQEHYKVGTAYEYVPTFFRTKEGITGNERKELTKHLKKLKAWTQANTGRVDEDILSQNKAEIAEIEELLKIGSGSPYNPERKQITGTYRDVLLPSEAKEALFKVDNTINSASFSAARGIAEQAIDLHRQSFLKAVSENPHWSMPKEIDPEMAPPHFRQLKGSRYGELNGMYVDKEIAKDIDDVGEVTNEFIRNWDKVMGLWKLGKAVYNPATHIANTISNTFLAHLGGVSPGDTKTYTQAAQAIRSRSSNKWFREAEEWGLMNNTFSAAELSQFRKALGSFRQHPEEINTAEKAKKFFGKWFNTPAVLYEKNEQFFKMAVFIKARKQGASIDQAATKAEEYLFNYRDVPPIVRHYKRWASPFFTFTYKWTGLVAKEVIRHPHKLALWGGTYAAWMKYAEHSTGAQEGQISKERQNMPGFGALHMPLPWRDRDGNMQYWDISRFTPLGVFDDKWGQTEIPVGAYAPTNNPFINVLYKVAMNKDSFTGQEIYNRDIDAFNTMLGKIGHMAWKEFTPSLTPGNYGFETLMDGVNALQRDIIDYTGQEVTFQDKAMQAILGVKVTSATEDAMNRTVRSEIMRIDQGIGRSISQLKRELNRGEITEEHFEEATRKYLQQRAVLKEAIQERIE